MTNEDMQKRAYAESMILLDSDECTIAIPMTEFAENWWGKGTDWSIISEEPSYFRDYHASAPLFVFNFQDGRKFQISLSADSYEIFDDNDDFKNLSLQDWRVVLPTFLWLNETYKTGFNLIPDEAKSPELCMASVKANGINLAHVPPEYRVREMCEVAVKGNPFSIDYVPDEFLDKKMYLIALEQSSILPHIAIDKIPPELIDEEIALKAISKQGYVVDFIPKKLLNESIFEAAINKGGEALKIVPTSLLTKEDCWSAVSKHNTSLAFIPQDKITKELCFKAVLSHGIALRYVPDQFLDVEMCMVALMQSAEALRNFPEELITREICWLACQKHHDALEFVPKKYRTEELCQMCFEKNAWALLDIPEDYRTVEMWVNALKREPELYNYMDDLPLEAHYLIRMRYADSIIQSADHWSKNQDFLGSLRNIYDDFSPTPNYAV